MAATGWGSLSEVESYGRLGGGNETDYMQVDFQESKKKYAEYMQAAHGMIFAKCDNVLWDLYQLKGAVLMQMRFDGVIGFPGGLIEKGEDLVEGLNREMNEEIGLNVDCHKFTDKHHVQTCVHHGMKLVLHFYAMEVTMQEFSVLEADVLRAPEYGIETFGVVRVPLYTMGDGLRGLPAFLTNQFCGNSRTQLLCGLKFAELLTEEELKEVMCSANQYLAQKRAKSQT